MKWDKCTEEQKSAYKNCLSNLLIQSPGHLLCCDKKHCIDPQCLSGIQQEYDLITNLVTEADKILPRHKPGVQKHWWSDELSRIRNQSIEIHRLWRAEGRPGSGPTNFERLRVRAEYRRAIKATQRAPKQAWWNRIHGPRRSFGNNSFTNISTLDGLSCPIVPLQKLLSCKL